ncbi:sigma-70 family RNA polymerase sigma factor [Sporosarcina sp. Marseille-Q4063]|uniref:sigma-70 family RNA polymerase sigma factor n=1 Tax=Sporosarcina sp. Marseille-Q4063 TaxID=2810514 RepID=UPI001BAF68E3|nr:sigma-70 family RNA polymerase sigma factor [Sporosarcina sp. Marseille-Q4063]QUW21295.1 sigma-70 family RNA polymerase sigma factor [Sporosarcina sp. Marseille-Q4063]
MHGRKGRILENFEEVLTQYEPMISAALRQLNIYRDHDSFRQAGRVALWQAWTRYEEGRGHFAPFASISIRGAMLDIIKREVRFEENVMQTEEKYLNDVESPATIQWSDRLSQAFKILNDAEREFIHWYFVEGLSQAECAEKAGVSVAGIKKRRHRMFVKLKGALQDNTTKEILSV